jgi:hypothetical protein
MTPSFPVFPYKIPTISQFCLSDRKGSIRELGYPSVRFGIEDFEIEKFLGSNSMETKKGILAFEIEDLA